MENDKMSVAYGEIVAKCWDDEVYKQDFIENPEGKLVEAGISIEEGVTYIVIEAPKMVKYIVLPYEDAKSAVQEVAKIFLSQSEKMEAIILPGFEVRIIQDAADTRHLILPASPKTLTAAELSAVTGGTGDIPGAASCLGSCTVINGGIVTIGTVVMVGPSPSNPSNVVVANGTAVIVAC